MFLKAFLDTRLYISPLSSYDRFNLIPFFSIFRHCLSGRRTPIRRPSRRTCNRRDRDGRCAGCFVQGFLYWKIRLLSMRSEGVKDREGKQPRSTLTDGSAPLIWNGNKALIEPIWDVEWIDWLPVPRLRQWVHRRPSFVSKTNLHQYYKTGLRD